MYPILGRFGSFILYSYTVINGLGLWAAIGLTSRYARRTPGVNWFDALLVTLLSGLVGGRIGFVWAQWSYFQGQPSEIWKIWQGGLNYHVALLAGVVGLWRWSVWRGESFTLYAGLFSPAFALFSAFGWFACWLEGCAYGRIAIPGLLTADLPDTYGVFDLRYQTQLLGLGLSLLVFIMVLWMERRQGAAYLFWITLLGLSISRVIISLLRADITLYLGQVRADTLGDGALAFLSLILLQYQRKSRLGG